MSAATARSSQRVTVPPASVEPRPFVDDDAAMLSIRSAVWSLFGIAELTREHRAAALSVGHDAFLCILSACVRDAGSSIESALRDCGAPRPGCFPVHSSRRAGVRRSHASETDTVGRLCSAVRHLAALESLAGEEFSSHSPAEFLALAHAALIQAGREAETALVELHGWRPGCFLGEAQPSGRLS